MIKICLIFLALWSTSVAFAAKPDMGKEFADQAAVAFKEQHFQQAAELFEKAYALGPEKLVRLRNAGRAWEEAGRLDYAQTQFKKYLDKAKPGTERDEVIERLRALEARIAAKTPAPTPATPVEAAAPAPAAPVAVAPAPVPAVAAEAKPVETVTAPAESPSKAPAWVTLSAGAALVVAGATWIVLTQVAAAKVTEGQNAGTYSPEKLARDESVLTQNRAVGASLLGVGAAGFVVGAIWLARQPAGTSAAAHVHPWFAANSAGLSFESAF